MSLEDFQLLDNESFDNSIIKRDFLKIYHQQGAQLNDSDQNIKFIFGENNNYHQIGNAYLEFDITVRPQNVLTNYAENDYIDQYRDLKLFYKEYVGEELLTPFVSYTDMKNKYPIQVIDLRFQADHITPKKIQVFQDYRAAPANARLYVILIRRREIEFISDGNKLIEVKVI